MSVISIRIAKKEDASRLVEIYTPYVLNTAITFELTPPLIDEFIEFMHSVLPKYPFIVAERDGVIVGYAYARALKEKPAYNHSVEISVYVDLNNKRSGIGRSLYKILERVLLKQNIYNTYACVTHTDNSSEYITLDSEGFHASMGYKKVAHFSHCGFKFNEWYDVIWMEKILRIHSTKPKDFIPFSKLKLEKSDFVLDAIGKVKSVSE
ncbi:MAG: GNAT family N-acetyltransferase [Succinivibrionaceae bacterium]